MPAHATHHYPSPPSTPEHTFARQPHRHLPPYPIHISSIATPESTSPQRADIPTGNPSDLISVFPHGDKLIETVLVVSLVYSIYALATLDPAHGLDALGRMALALWLLVSAMAFAVEWGRDYGGWVLAGLAGRLLAARSGREEGVMRGSVEAAKDVFAARAVTTPQTSPSRRQPRRVGSTSSLLSDATTSTPELRSPILWAGSDDSEDESLGGASEDTIFLGGSDEGSSMFLSSSPPASPARSEGTCVDSDNGYMSDNTASSVEGIVGGIQLSIDTSGAKHGNVWRRSAAAASPVTEAKQRARAAWMRAGGRDGISAA